MPDHKPPFQFFLLSQRGPPLGTSTRRGEERRDGRAACGGIEPAAAMDQLAGAGRIRLRFGERVSEDFSGDEPDEGELSH